MEAIARETDDGWSKEMMKLRLSMQANHSKSVALLSARGGCRSQTESDECILLA